MMSYLHQRDKIILVLIAGFMAFVPMNEVSQWAIFLGLMLLFGLPHGAIDHILFFSGGSKPFDARAMGFFLGYYLLVMFAYSLLWFFFPEFSLYVFIIISSYHFGQSQLYYLPQDRTRWMHQLMYFLWGAAVLMSLLYFNRQESIQLIKPVANSLALVLSSSYLIWMVIGLWFVWGLTFITRKGSTLVTLGFEWLEIAALILLFSQVSLVLSFAIFFGLWHSYKAIRIEIEKLNQGGTPFNWRIFFKKSVLFTLISVLGLVVLIQAGNNLQTAIQPLFLFFIAISVLTMPHMLIFEKFLGNRLPSK